jgi:polysaccharide chain length determinant protein (PEP-CTERM system associated)
VVPFTAATSIVACLPNVYQSTVTMLVERQQVPEAFVRPTVTSALDTRLRAITQDVLSRSRLEGIITRFQLYPDLRKTLSHEAVIERMRNDIALDLRGADPHRRGPTVAFAVSYRGLEPHTVAAVTNALAAFYIQEDVKVRGRQAAGTAEFLKVQLDEARRRLDVQERQVSEFKRRNLAGLPQQVETSLGVIDRLDAQLRLNVDNQTRLGERRLALARRVDQVPLALASGAPAAAPAPAPAPEAPTLAGDLERMRQELRRLQTRYTDRHPSVVRLRSAISRLEIQLLESPEAAAPVHPVSAPALPVAPPPMPNPYLALLRQEEEAVDAELRALKAEEHRLRDALAVHVNRVQHAPRLEQEFKEISRDYESTRALYASLSQRHAEAEIAESMEERQKGEQFRVLDPAVPSAAPAAPKRLRLIVLAVAMSGAAAAGMVAVAETLDTSFHSVDALRAFTAVPVIASIPPIITDADARRRRRRFQIAAGATLLLLLIIVVASYLLAHGNERLAWW